MESNKSAALASSLTGIICDVRIRRLAGERRPRLTSANRRLRRHWPPDAMPQRCREFVDSRLRRSPPDRASAVPSGTSRGKRHAFPHLAHRSAAVHKLHSTTATTRYEFDSGEGETFSRQPALAYSPRKLSKQPGPSHPALWITALKRPSLLTRSATLFAPAMVDKSPRTASLAPGAADSASRQRSS